MHNVHNLHKREVAESDVKHLTAMTYGQVVGKGKFAKRACIADGGNSEWTSGSSAGGGVWLGRRPVRSSGELIFRVRARLAGPLRKQMEPSCWHIDRPDILRAS